MTTTPLPKSSVVEGLESMTPNDPFPFNSFMGPFLIILFHITCPTPFALVSTPGFCLVPSECPAWVCPGVASGERCLCLVDLYSCYSNPDLYSCYSNPITFLA
jgi:hypothetical protein